MFGSRRRQPDLFDAALAPYLAAEVVPWPIHRPDPDRVRGRLRAIVEEVRAADALPWSPADLRCYRTIVPQMTLVLPGDEAARWRADFDAELTRLAA